MSAPAELLPRLALVLDSDDLVEALRLAQELAPWFGVVKVGLELYTAAGPDAVTALSAAGFEVFCDLKLYDIPTTVRRAARVVASLGASYLTVHAQGGPVMVRAAVEGLAEGAAAAGLAEPMALAVTVLTSDAGAPAHILGHRVACALDAGCRGVVCAAADVHEVKQLAPRLACVVPGIRMADTATHDQARFATPAEALAAGADLLVVGRTVTKAADPAAAAEALVRSLTGV
ncbi:MAG: orotidine-5'-phosphate decarboxylase [Acidimicrobiales bacterium]